MTLELYGYQFSVYSWMARLAFEEKGKDYHWIEVNPFARDVPESYLALHPFKRVPTLVHDDFQIYETSAITRYVDEAFPGPRLRPTDSRHRARCGQILSIIDSYAYWPLVRQVFSHRVFRPRLRGPSDATEIQRGLAAAPRVLAALERLAADTDYLCGAEISLADIHLAPVIGIFCDGGGRRCPPEDAAQAQPLVVDDVGAERVPRHRAAVADLALIRRSVVLLPRVTSCPAPHKGLRNRGRDSR
jgi:glutathione S-transferase